MRCSKCGHENTLRNLRKWFAGPEYYCPSCNAYLFLQHDGQRIPPEMVVSTAWNSTKADSLISVDATTGFFIAKTDRDFLQLRLLQHLARGEEPSIKMVYRGMQAIILVHHQIGEAIGYILWCPPELFLNQIFIRTEYQRQGYGSRFLQSWVKQFVPDGYHEIKIEAPNEKCQKLLAKNSEYFYQRAIDVKQVG